MANTTDADARNVHGTNPQYLVEKIVRMRIYDNMYWKEHCFGLTASSLIGKAVELDHVGGTFGGNNKPTKFLCLVLKMLQLQPEKDIVLQYITNTEFKYVRALGAFYLRLTGSAVDVYTHLEPLYSDLRKLRKRSVAGWEIIHVDEFVDAMLREETCCTIALPHLAQRHVLVLESHLPGPRASVLDAEFAQFTAAAEAKATAEAEAAAEALAAAQAEAAEAAALAAEEAEAARARSAATERAAVPQDQRHQRRRSRSPERRGEYRRDRDRDRDQRNQRPRRSRSRSRSRERYGGGGSSRAREDRGGGRGGGRDREWDRGSRRSSDAERGRDRRSQRRRSRSRSPPPRSRDYDDRHRRNDRGAAARVESSAPSGPPSDAASAPAAVSASASAPVYGTQAAYVAAKKAAEAEKKAMKKAAKKKKKKKKSKGGDGGDATDLAGGGSKAELSTDQWNALRAELGMKPLNEK